MSLTTIIIILALIGVVVTVAWLFRSILTFVLLAIAIYVLFHIGFIWGYDDMNKYLHLDTFLKPEVSEKLETEFGTFEKKREEFGVVETEEIKRVVDESLQNAWEEAGQRYDAIDKEALIKELEAKLESYNQEEVDKAIEEVEAEIDAMTQS